MAQKKAFEVDSWLAKPDPRFSIVLIYGPDRGLVAERGSAFARKTGLALDDPFSVVKLDAADVDKDDGRLLDEARTVPMFSDRRLLWVRNAGAQKSLTEDIKALIASPPGDAIILVEAGDLKKGAALRTMVEGAGNAMALPCYADSGRDIDQLIDEELQQAGMTIGLEARHALRRNLGGDRLASRGEVAKLVLFAHGKTEIGLDDVRALTGDVSGQSFDDALDALLEGRVEDFDAAFTRQCAAGGHPFQALLAVMRQFQSLHTMRATADADGKSAAAVVAAARPPVFFSRRKSVERALERWSSEALFRALTRLQSAVLQTRRRADMSTTVARQALLGIAVEGARLLNRRG